MGIASGARLPGRTVIALNDAGAEALGEDGQGISYAQVEELFEISRAGGN